MGVENLNKIFNPKSIAVVGASEKKESVGYKLLYNMINAGYKGDIHPVNPGKDMIQGFHAYPSVKDIPGTPDLAIIAVPAAIVPNVVEECGSAGVLGLIIVSAGFKEIGVEGRRLEEEIQKKQRQYGLRIIGPNCLGVMRPSYKLNATFSNRMALHSDRNSRGSYSEEKNSFAESCEKVVKGTTLALSLVAMVPAILFFLGRVRGVPSLLEHRFQLAQSIVHEG